MYETVFDRYFSIGIKFPFVIKRKEKVLDMHNILSYLPFYLFICQGRLSNLFMDRH